MIKAPYYKIFFSWLGLLGVFYLVFFKVDLGEWHMRHMGHMSEYFFSAACYLAIWNYFLIGFCTDGAPVNVKIHSLIETELGEHYLLTLCPAYKIELVIQDTFESSNLNNNCNIDYVNVFCLFKKANFRWRLFKRQSIFEGIPYILYKQPSGTHWVEHQCATLNSHIQLNFQFSSDSATIKSLILIISKSKRSYQNFKVTKMMFALQRE